jgi:intein/homing endonuclease
VYASVGNVWKSGRKKTYVLKTNDAKIRLTAEHLVYIPQKNSYKPVMELTPKDNIYILKGKQYFHSQ